VPPRPRRLICDRCWPSDGWIGWMEMSTCTAAINHDLSACN
jgi:hypothetical protein